MADTPEPPPLPGSTAPSGITLNLVGPRVGGPSLSDLITLATRLTGRAPTDDEIRQAREIYASIPPAPPADER